jgi:hypothetical protein
LIFVHKVCRHGKDIAKTSGIAIPWTYVPVASKLGLRPQTVSPRRHISSHGMTQSFPMFAHVFPMLHHFVNNLKKVNKKEKTI